MPYAQAGRAARPRPRGRGMAGTLLRDPLLLVVIAVSALLIGWFLRGGGEPGTQVVVFWTALPFYDLVLWAVPRRLARHPGTPATARRFWRAISTAGALFGLGDLIQVTYAWRHPGAAAAVPVAAQAVLILAGIGTVLWVMLTYPHEALTRQARIRFWLDAAAVLIGATVLVGVLVLPGGAVPSGAPAAVLLGCALVLLGAFAATKLVLVGNAPLTAGAAVPMLTACGVQGVFGAMVSGAPGGLSVLLAVQMVPPVLICIGPRVQELTVRHDSARLLRRSRRPYSFLPYATLVVMFALLVVVLPAGLGVTAQATLAGLLAITCLVVVRQLIAFRENDTLLRRLDAGLLALGEQEQRIRALVECSSDITSTVTADGTVTYVTPATMRILGRGNDTLVGTRVTDHIHPDDLPALAPDMAHLMATPDAALTYQARFAHADGSWRWLEVVNRNLIRVPGVNGVVSNARDVTEARVLQDRLRHEASHDGLTGLANRALFGERLADVAASGTAVLHIDLDGFKAVNDTHGHHVGDAVLAEVADRLRAVVPSGGLPARLGGDEFAVLLPGADLRTAESLAARFRRSLHEPMTIDGLSLAVRASVGAVAGTATDPEALLRMADERMYEAKRSAGVLAAAQSGG